MLGKLINVLIVILQLKHFTLLHVNKIGKNTHIFMLKLLKNCDIMY